MPAPKKPNTEAATAAVRRRGDETAARRLRDAGWLVVPPEQVGLYKQVIDPTKPAKATTQRKAAKPMDLEAKLVQRAARGR